MSDISKEIKKKEYLNQDLFINESLNSTTLDFVEIEIDAAKIVNYAAVQNDVPIIHHIKILNKSELELKDFELRIGCNPDLYIGQRFKFEKLIAGEMRTFTQTKLNLGPNHKFLSDLNEAEQGQLIIKIYAPGFEETIKMVPIQILARNEWGATLGLTELLSAHVQPNSSQVDRIVAQASVLLKKSNSNLSMNGYQSKNREYVWKQVNAIYRTLCLMDFQYAPPPASFEKTGQKIRTPEQILDTKLVTCLDTAVLMAACFEQAGLNAVVFVKEGHAWVGVWLIDTCFGQAVEDSPQAIRKRVASGELLLLETTVITHTEPPTMRKAKADAEIYLEDDQQNSFQFAIDIKRSREAHIRAMKTQSREGGNSNSSEGGQTGANFLAPVGLEDMPALPPIDPAILEPEKTEVAMTPQGRLIHWKSKLLDLTLRNKLLNFKPTKKFLKIVTHSPSSLEDMLATEGVFKFLPSISFEKESDPRSEEIFRQEHGMGSAQEHAQRALVNREIVFDAPKENLNTISTAIYREGKNALEETGCNSLYVAIGMLHWKETPESETVLKAPILLVPVKLKRGAVGAGVRLERIDEDTLFNPTLMQKLLTTFEVTLPYVDGQLPVDHSGVDVEKIFQVLRTKVQELKGFEVRDECFLGNFSFTKYVMWKDLESNAEDLQKSKVVNHLINHKGESFHDETETVKPEEIDKLFSPQSLFTPLLCDSSQLAVICTADRGKNMVVEGPPGTGKSQTITNLISHCLTQGKTVLFVAEKMAALEVVHKRLKDIELENFCLELHSAKTKKSEIAKQFVSTLDSVGKSLAQDWEREAERLASLRNDLNAFEQVLHGTHRNGLTVYYAIGLGIKYCDKNAAKFNWPDPDTHSHMELGQLEDCVGELAALASRLDTIANHPLSDIGKTEWTPSWQEELLTKKNECINLVEGLKQSIDEFSSITPLEKTNMSLAELESADELAANLMLACQTPIESIEQALNTKSKKVLGSLIEHGKKRNDIWNYFKDYSIELKSLESTTLKLQWRSATLDWWPKKLFTKRNVTSQIRLYSENKTRLRDDDVIQFLEKLNNLNEEDKFITENSSTGQSTLGEAFKAENTDWVEAAKHLSWMNEFTRSMQKVYESKMESLDELRNKLRTRLCEQYESFYLGGNLYKAAQRYRERYTDFKTSIDELIVLANPRLNFLGGPEAPSLFTSLKSISTNWESKIVQLQPWCVWNSGRKDALAKGLGGLIEEVENGSVNLKNLKEYFIFSYSNWWLKRIMDNEPLLSGFSGASHIHKIEEFKKVDEKFQTLTVKYIKARLMGKIPREKELVGEMSGEVSFLRREAQKQRQHKSIRELIKRSPNVLPRLKPCMLMSPQSVAQYLEAGSNMFDIVVFDEASQIPTWDSVGAIARGKQLVCVGDPKQLPPTNFFNASDSEGVTDDDSIQEMESILDECLGVGMPLSRLNWHYRSRNEGLITFSNYQYYENSLITFPSPVEIDNSVEFINSKGIYDSGKSRTNKLEAEMIVEEIATHYKTGLGDKFSLGVITFNSSQQSLIEKLLDAKRLSDRELDMSIANANSEELFIKNLENVQGDERDYILFSITFGKDANGKLSMNFGPMNKEGGHRRLNVAVTRARYKVKIFSSLRPEDIDLSRTKARGAIDLKTYLDFALHGPRVLGEQALPTGLEPESPFEVEVINKLRNHGWQVVPQVGISGYRIDIGIINRHQPGKFLLGIECDGATYHSAPSARDRDRLRQLVLEGLGWNIHRIWSTDWWFNPEIPMKSLLNKLEVLDEEAEKNSRGHQSTLNN